LPVKQDNNYRFRLAITFTRLPNVVAEALFLAVKISKELHFYMPKTKGNAAAL